MPNEHGNTIIVIVDRDGRWTQDRVDKLSDAIFEMVRDGGSLQIAEPKNLSAAKPNPIPMLINCPECRQRHIDKGEFSTKPHHTHACQSCGFTWRPAIVPTVGVQFLPGFKDEE